jgi:hypothetical protein
MLVKILIGVAGVLVLFVAVVATRPSAYHVERKLEVAAPADLVFGVLNESARLGSDKQGQRQESPRVGSSAAGIRALHPTIRPHP